MAISSKYANKFGNQYWNTPKYLFDTLKENFDIKLDAATTEDNPLKTEYFFTESDNGLGKKWMTWTFCNPPYKETGLWVKKAFWELRVNGTGSLLLIPANTDTRWFHDYIWNRYQDQSKEGITVKFIYKRIKFIGSEDPAPAKFSSMLVIFHGNLYRNRYINIERPTLY